MITVRSLYCLFTMQFSQTINTSGCSLLVFLAGSVIGVSTKHIVCADMNQQAVSLFNGNGKILRGFCIEQFYKVIFIWIFWIRLIPGAARKALIGVLTCLVLCLAMSVGIWLKYEIAPVSCETIVALDPGLK